jgi:hypothetical protein
MMKDDDDLEGCSSKRPSSSNSDDSDIAEVMDDDAETCGTDQSENVQDIDDDDDETDDTDENSFSKDQSFKTFATPPKQQRNVTLVLSKTRTSVTTSDANKTHTTDGSDITTTPMKINSHATASPIRIKLSLKKLPISSVKASDEFTARDPTQYESSNSSSNLVPDQNVSSSDVGISSNADDDHVSPTTKAIKTESTTKVCDMQTPIPRNLSSNGDFQSADKPLTTNTTTKLSSQKSLPIISKAATGTASKRRSFLPTKQVRMPPLTSPGLRMLRPPIHIPPPPIASNNTTASSTYYTPQQVFSVVMAGAGYTFEQRTNHPHRGSSVLRTVDDMFDTNVHLALHPIELIPKKIWNHIPGSNEAESSSMMNNSTNLRDAERLPHLLIAALDKYKKSRTVKSEAENYASNTATRKRKRPSFEPLQLRDMVPVSLTIPYPEWYLQKRAEYVKLVKQREMAIVEWQAAQEELDMSGGDYFVSDSEITKSNGSPYANPISIPPIPQPPDPPKIHELIIPSGTSVREDSDDALRISNSIAPYMDSGALDFDNKSYDESTHPYYLPKARENLVGHLDPNCFHITDGRYFGLETNLIADPNFIGPNVPGLSGSTNTGGLATATTSTTTSTSGLTGGGMTMILSASYHSAAAVAPASIKEEIAHTSSIKGQPIQLEEVPVKSKSPTVNFVDTPSAVGLLPAEKPTKIVNNEMSSNLSATRTLSDLRSIMEGDNIELIESFRECIVRSIVHTYRSNKSVSGSFHGPNDETYPDIGKAFAWFGGIKPCDRCKSNKQGVRTNLVYIILVVQ